MPYESQCMQHVDAMKRRGHAHAVTWVHAVNMTLNVQRQRVHVEQRVDKDMLKNIELKYSNRSRSLWIFWPPALESRLKAACVLKLRDVFVKDGALVVTESSNLLLLSMDNVFKRLNIPLIVFFPNGTCVQESDGRL